MTSEEIARWSRRAGRVQLDEVGQVGIDAHNQWLFCITNPHELTDLRPWAESPKRLTARMVAEIAGNAAVEVAIVCSLWPGPLRVPARKKPRKES